MEVRPFKILLVEDNPGDACLVREVLAESATLPFELVHVERLRDACARLRRGPCDVILLDLSLADSQGLQTLARIHDEAPHVPILIVTGLNDDAVSAQAVRQGAQDYLVKEQVNGLLLTRAIRYAIERHRLLAELRDASLFDELTGLYNRRGLLTVAGPLGRNAARLDKGISLLFLDLDNMKWINDTFGHPEGDRALVETACILKGTFRKSDILARLGGDEFAVLALVRSETCGPLLTARLQQAVEACNRLPERRYPLSLSVGLAYCNPEYPFSFDQLLARADAVMYDQKRRKHNQSPRGPPASVRTPAATPG